MMRMRVIVFAMLTIGCGDQREPPEPAPEPRVGSGPTAPAAAVAAASPPRDLALGHGLELRRPVRDGRLVVVPIIATAEPPTQRYITLHDAMARHIVTVREQPGEWEVDRVRVRNRSALPLLVVGGELVLDAHQDRVFSETVIVAARTSADVGVRCVEANRDHGTNQFNPGNVLAQQSLRRMVAHGDQSGVWAEVDRINQRLGLAPETQTYRHAAVKQAKATAARRARLAAQLAAHRDRDRMVGIAVAVDGQVIGIDRFATPALYRALEPELLGSYAVTDDGPPREGRALTPEAVRAFARRATAIATTDASFTAL